MHIYQECIRKHLYYLLNFFITNMKTIFFFFKELSTLKIQHFASTELSLAIKYYQPLFPQPVAVKHRQHLDYVTFLCWTSLPASLCLLSLPGSWLALPHLLCQASHACKGGEWCFRQTWNKGETKLFQFHSWQYGLESTEIHIIPV